MKTIVVLVVMLLACGIAHAQVTSDGTIFSDDFNSGFDTTKWGVMKDDTSEAGVSSGMMYLFTNHSIGESAHIYSNSVLDYGSATEWVVEVRFKAAAVGVPLSNGAGDRSVTLIRGISDEEFPGSYGSTRDFAVQLLDYEQTTAPFTLGWDQWHGAGTTVLAPGISLARDTWHDLVLHHKSDNTIDFYVDGAYVTNKASLGGGVPARLYAGDGTSDAGGAIYFDGIKVGAPVVPEPSALFALGGGLTSLVAFVRRRRA